MVINDFPSRHSYVLALLQHHTVRIMAEWIAELSASFRRGVVVGGHRADVEALVT
jgi:hypothetical protein